jgi:hypothetical protein
MGAVRTNRLLDPQSISMCGNNLLDQVQRFSLCLSLRAGLHASQADANLPGPSHWLGGKAIPRQGLEHSRIAGAASRGLKDQAHIKTTNPLR